MQKSDYIFGRRAIMEAIDAGKDIERVIVKHDLSGELSRELMTKVKEAQIPVQRVPVERLNRITKKNHQGAIAILSAVTYYRLSDAVMALFEAGKDPFLVVLDGVTDTRNFGAIARSAECAGADAIVIPERNSAGVTADAVKTSAGALMVLPVCRETSVTQAVDFLKASGIKVVAATEKGAEDYTAIDMKGPVAIVMGAEDTGISNEVLKKCDALARIPILGDIGSLNVSVAAGVMMYEVVRQRGV